ncbi:RloB family protein [Imhoffiella purpurea]|uniref:RloB-like protein n=1 Tax=Imhoffiella purpurea TaxID=1249627 RepID=W9VZA9_9GAMM|nr:RloB family protein [Imhoffiella purpurea]EXJ15725.1 hypothetical protein D779_1113 [Imhoffiella purpurea]
MALTKRRPRPLDRAQEHVRDTRLVIIAAEGQQTERQYFAMFRSTRVQVKVLAAGADNRSAPEYVLERLRRFQDEYQLDEGDSLWLMLDVDRWGSDKLAAVAREAKSVGFGLAVSNPCFEVWLLYHFTADIPATDRCGDIEQALRQATGSGYNKSRLQPECFAPHLSAALERSEAADPSPRGRWPKDPGSHVYRVIRELPEEAMPSAP